MIHEAFNPDSCLQSCFVRHPLGADRGATGSGGDPHHHAEDSRHPCQAQLSKTPTGNKTSTTTSKTGASNTSSTAKPATTPAKTATGKTSPVGLPNSKTPLPRLLHPSPAPKTSSAAQWITTGSGLKYQDVVVGKGPLPKPGDDILVNYTGRFTNGKVFDSSLAPGRGPFELHLGRGEVIKGWDEGLSTMHVGESAS